MRGIRMKLKLCQYEDTCQSKNNDCWENTMTDLHAKPIIENKFWIVEKDGAKFATLRKNEDNRFVPSDVDTEGFVIWNNDNFNVVGEIEKHLTKVKEIPYINPEKNIVIYRKQ